MVQESDALVIGAGPAGLAVGAALRARGVTFEILEAERTGAAWHRHYDRLHLHTPKNTSSLPGLRFPSTYPRYPSRRQFIDYLEAYARVHELQPQHGECVAQCAREADGIWRVQSASCTWRARHLVFATGVNRAPNRPSWPGVAPAARVLHSSEYSTGASFRGRDVLVVGFGNSGAEIALDLHEHGARPVVSLRGPVNVVPREIAGIPVTSIARIGAALPPVLADRMNALAVRWALGDVARLGLARGPAGPLADLHARRRVPVIDVGTIAAIRSGAILVRPGVAGFEGEVVVFGDGRRQRFDAVILATGFRTGLTSLLAPGDATELLDTEGYPAGPPGEPGRNAHFCGFAVAPAGALREIAREAVSIGSRIAAALRR